MRHYLIVYNGSHTITSLVGTVSVIVSDNLANRYTTAIFVGQIKTLALIKLTTISLCNRVPLINKTNSIVGTDISDIKGWILHHACGMADRLLVTCIEFGFQLRL